MLQPSTVWRGFHVQTQPRVEGRSEGHRPLCVVLRGGMETAHGHLMAPAARCFGGTWHRIQSRYQERLLLSVQDPVTWEYLWDSPWGPSTCVEMGPGRRNFASDHRSGHRFRLQQRWTRKPIICLSSTIGLHRPMVRRQLAAVGEK